MIKLIAADMDGTLLTTDKRLPPDFGKLIDALHERGILFVIATGRPMVGMQNMFAPWRDKMGFISDNGAVIIDKGEYLKRELLTAQEARHILTEVLKVEKLIPCIEGNKTCFYESDYPPFVEKIHRFFENSEKVDDIFSILEREPISKVAAIDYIDAPTNGFVKLEGLKDTYEVMLSGEDWIDVAVKGTEKGRGFVQMLELLGIAPEESMAFGDFLNDTAMMKACPNSYAMKNGHPLIKAISRYETAFTNDEYGVAREIERVLGLELG